MSTYDQNQTIDLTTVTLYCETCKAPKGARNRDGKDICCEDCHTIIASLHPKPVVP